MDRRSRKKARTRRAMQEAALELFLTRGYEATTVAQIAEAAGVSHMTFFRYFPTKEDVVLQDEYDPMLEELIRAQSRTEDPLERIRAATMTGLGMVYEHDRDALFERSHLLLTIPALRARVGENLASARTAFERGLSAPGEVDSPPLRVRAVAAACAAALTVAVTAWVEDEGRAELPDLIADAFDALRGDRHQIPPRDPRKDT